MIEISPALRPALAPLLLIAALALSAAYLVARPSARVSSLAAVARRGAAAALLTVLITLVSVSVWSGRHAGTGTELARGYPRVVHTTWIGFASPDVRARLVWRGLAENAVVYAPLILLTLVIRARLRRDA